MKKRSTLLIVIGWLMPVIVNAQTNIEQLIKQWITPEKLCDCLKQYWQQAHQYFISKSDT